MGPDDNQNLIVRVLLFIFVAMFMANTIAQFLQISYKEPFYLATWLLPVLGVVVYAYYQHKNKQLPKLLVVEDQEFWTTIIIFCLKDQYQLIICKSGEEALRFLRECPRYELPEKAIIDKFLPGIDGIELIKQIGEMGINNMDINILSVSPPTTEPEKQFMDMWLLKVPETFKGSHGLMQALKQDGGHDLKSIIMKLLPAPKKELKQIERNDDTAVDKKKPDENQG